MFVAPLIHDDRTGKINTLNACAQIPLDIRGRIPLRKGHGGVIYPRCQNLLRQGWAIVGGVRLFAKDTNWSRVARPSQRFCGAETTHRSPHNDDGVNHA
jgi:hypothetical protein